MRQPLSNGDKRYLARIYAKSAYMENTSEGMEESEYWCGVGEGIRKVANEVFNVHISAREYYEGGKLMKYVVYFDYERVEVAVSEIGGCKDAR